MFNSKILKTDVFDGFNTSWTLSLCYAMQMQNELNDLFKTNHLTLLMNTIFRTLY